VIVKISENQIMQLISVCRSYAEDLRRSISMMEQLRGTQIQLFLKSITDQQSEELKVIE